MRLDIGTNTVAAYLLADDWRTVDLLPPADYVAPMWQLPFINQSIDEIHTSHALEHISKERVLPTLREWYRVLIPGAPVTIRVPDLEYICTQYLEALRTETVQAPVIGWNIDMLFGNQEHEGQFHLTGFSRRSLPWYVAQVGFIVERVGCIWSHNQQTLELYGRKPNAHL